MSLKSAARKVAWLFRRNRFASELREEMQFHVELRARKLHDQGVRPEDAPFAARRRFGNLTAQYDASAAVWGWTAWERLLQDFRLGLRTLLKAPGFTATVILTLAIGLGINTAIFSLVNGVALRPLPYPDPARLVAIYETQVGQGPPNLSSSGARLGGAVEPLRTSVSVANLPDYRRAHAFNALAHCQLTSKALTGLGAPEQLQGEAVSANFFDALEIAPEQGRGFLPEDESPAAPRVAIVTYDFWQHRLGGAADVLSRIIHLDAVPYQVIGVLPRGFQSPFQLTETSRVEFYTPALFKPALLASRGDHEINVVGRLNPAVTIGAAQAELDIIGAALAKAYPESNAGIRPIVTPLRTDLARNVSSSLMALLGASVLIVLITCVNVANLLLVRAAARAHESSVRMALGAGRFRMVRQFLAESLLLAAGGCVAGLGLGWALIRIVLADAPPDIPRIHEVSMDWRVFGTALAVATLTGLIFGLAPAWHAAQARAAESLKSAGRTTGARTQAWWRAGLTVAEIALSLMLLIGTGLVLKSFFAAAAMDLGFQPDRVLAMSIRLPELRYPDAQKRLAFFRQLEDRVRSLPGVQAVAYGNRMPLRGGWGGSTNVDIAPSVDVDTDKQTVSPGYFETLGIPLLRGRVFTENDRDGQPPVGIINREFARRLLPGVDPLGHRVRLGSGAPWMTVVGVVNDIRRSGKEGVISAQLYIPAAQTRLYPVNLADFAVRTAGDPKQLVPAIQAQVLALDKDQPIVAVRTMDELIDAAAAQRRFGALLMALFAAVAILLAMVGIFGVLANVVGQRTGELGIRMALGASPRGIITLVLRQAGLWIAGGITVGLAGALVLTRYLSSLLFHVKTYDPWTYLAAATFLAAVAAAAALIPAARGSRTDPIRALRYE